MFYSFMPYVAFFPPLCFHLLVAVGVILFLLLLFFFLLCVIAVKLLTMEQRGFYEMKVDKELGGKRLKGCKKPVFSFCVIAA